LINLIKYILQFSSHSQIELNKTQWTDTQICL